MALRELMLNKKIQEKRSELAGLVEQKNGYKLREEDLEKAIEEAKTEEEIKTVEEEIEQLEKEKQETDDSAAKLEEEIEQLEKELDEVRSEKKEVTQQTKKEEVRTGGNSMIIKRGFFQGMKTEERDAVMKREEVKAFAARLREYKDQSRAVTGAELTIPEVLLETLRDNLNRYSKLIKHIRLKPLKGKARQNIAGKIPEGIWTEAIASLNELEIEFNQIEMDGYKVGGYIPVHNSTLEDSDENLVSEIMDALSQAVGIAVDKAIIYGTGKKMPLGIVTRLAQPAKPETWNDNEPDWVDLHTSNVKKLNIKDADGAKFFAALIKGLGAAKENYSDGKKVWCMNSTTKTEIMAKAITFNAAGTIVASMNDEMPIIGGKIETFDFMKDDDIVGGYASLYTMVERHGGTFETSSHVKFIEEQTVFKGSARYDGRPVIGEGFVIVNLGNVAPTTSVEFAGQKKEESSGETEK